MPTVAEHRTDIQRVLVDATSLLLERARIELERQVAAAGDSASQEVASSLVRFGELEAALRTIRQELSVAGRVTTSMPGRQVSRFYEVPGQEDA